MNIVKFIEYQQARDEVIALEEIEFKRQENRERLKRVLEICSGMIDQGAPLEAVKNIMIDAAALIKPKKKDRFLTKLIDELSDFKL